MKHITELSYKEGEVWKHTFLSNGFIEPDGTFVEREYQAAKTLDKEWYSRILQCTKPFGSNGSKELGRQAPQRADWEEIKYQTMCRHVIQKFIDHPTLAQQLLATGDAYITESNEWHDNIWGNCTCGRPECSTPGTNWLGHILMTTREALRNQKFSS
jgi:hypothetical protein